MHVIRHYTITSASMGRTRLLVIGRLARDAISGGLFSGHSSVCLFGLICGDVLFMSFLLRRWGGIHLVFANRGGGKREEEELFSTPLHSF